jgi:hypothetical protein
MQQGSFEKLSGEVEADETFVGRPGTCKRRGAKKIQGRSASGKVIVMGGFNRSVQHDRVFRVVQIGGMGVANLGRPGLPAVRKKELWDSGRPRSPLAISLGRFRSFPAPSTGYSKQPSGSLYLSDTGQSRCSAWPSGRRSLGDLRPEIRCALSRSGWAGLDCKPGRGGGNNGHYRAVKADERTWDRLRSPKDACSSKTITCTM